MLLFPVFAILSCENNSFDSDKRQLIAKRKVREKLENIQSFDLISFKEDTLRDYNSSIFKNPIRYSFTIQYQDSTGATQNKNAFVLFTPDGRSVISTHINN